MTLDLPSPPPMQDHPEKTRASLIRLRYLQWFVRWCTRGGKYPRDEAHAKQFLDLYTKMASTTDPQFWLDRSCTDYPLKLLILHLLRH
jgi:hypothetical protein